MLKHDEHLHLCIKQTFRETSRVSLLTVLLASISFSALAIAPIPEKDGVSGFINLGIFSAKIESNLLAEMPFVDLGTDTIASVNDEPDSKGFILPSASYELSYTWANSRIQLYIGNQLEDFLRFDLTTNIGIRKKFGGAGIFALEAITSSLRTKVWSDPYATNTKRSSTNNITTGARVIWDQILGSALEIRVSSVSIELDNERSGTASLATASQRALLNREGDVNRLDIEYAFSLGKGSLLVPRLHFADFDLDGEAMAHDSTTLELSYVTNIGSFKTITNITFGKQDFDIINPIYGIKDEADSFGFNTTLAWANIFGAKDWIGNASFIYINQDHDINFYNTKATAIRIGALHRF